MGHNSVVSGHPKSTEILLVDGLSTEPRILGVTFFKSLEHKLLYFMLIFKKYEKI